LRCYFRSNPDGQLNIASTLAPMNSPADFRGTNGAAANNDDSDFTPLGRILVNAIQPPPLPPADDPQAGEHEARWAMSHARWVAARVLGYLVRDNPGMLY
jgi:hypothetical protein